MGRYSFSSYMFQYIAYKQEINIQFYWKLHQNIISIIHLETDEVGLTDETKNRILHKLYALSSIHDLVYNFATY